MTGSDEKRERTLYFPIPPIYGRPERDPLKLKAVSTEKSLIESRLR